MAANCLVPPATTLGLTGITAIDCSAVGVTDSTVVPVTPSNVALIEELPGANAVARPCEPKSLEIVAIEVAADAHVTRLVRFWVDLSE